MASGNRRNPTDRALKLAKSLLAGGARHELKGNIMADLAALLAELGIRPAEIVLGHPTRSGRIDLYLPRYRAIFETEARARAADPNLLQPDASTPARVQLERHLTSEIGTELGRLTYAPEKQSHADWTGIVTDGRYWRVHSYPHDEDAVNKGRLLHSGRFEGGASDLVARLLGWLDRELVGRTWIPADPSPLFEGQHEELARLYEEMPVAVARKTQTKRALWHDMLRVSGMSPPGQAAPDRLFVTHSLLIAVARMVTHLMAHRSDDWRLALSEGFASWVLDWQQGDAWARELWGTVSRYDWHRRRGDVLRSLYEAFVAESDRKVFGEFYTPDWLAAKMVKEALDDEWLDDAIRQADHAMQAGTVLNGKGILDPACGSGTFLYHAALRMLEAPAMQDLQPQQRADAAALLLNGIDVHPVAVEIARANIMRVLQPTAGESALRVHLGDSLLTGEDRGSLFGHVEGSLRLVTPGGREILIPVAFARQDEFGDRMRQLVRAASSGKDLPEAVLDEHTESLREDLTRCKDELAAAISVEGNSVWTWYALNVAGPHLLAERKVDRIVANPPWVKLAHIQERGRKRAMEQLASRMGLQAGGRMAPHLDVASFFVLRARELYLNDPGKDPAVWLVKKSALRAGHWRLFREKHKGTLAQSIDLEALQPFGGGDARRCCLLMEHRSARLWGASAGTSQAQPPVLPPIRLEARLRGLRKPRPDESWSAVKERIQFMAAPEPLPQGRSQYSTSAFRLGATILPHVLVVVERSFPEKGNRIRVRTRRSIHAPWSSIPSQDVEIPKRWLATLHCSRNMLPFVDPFGSLKAIVPTDRQGELDLDSALDELDWARLDELYRRYRGKGMNTPKRLTGRMDYGKGLSSQPGHRLSARTMVLYPSSGDIMRAARTFPGSGFVDHTLFWHVASQESEAAYLTALLNAPCLRQAFFESRESGRSFQLHPWRKVPIPRFDPNDPRHLRLAKLCERAETAARPAAEDARRIFPGASQTKLSKAVRKRLAADGIFEAIDEIVAQLLPDQAVTGTES